MSLSDFRPTGSMVQDIKRELVNAGINGENIPVDWLEAIAAATFKWIASKPEGLKQASRLLQATWKQGAMNEEYFFHGGKVQHDDVYFMQATMVKGEMVPPSSVESKDKYKVQCDECGGSVHCVRDVYNYNKDRTDSLCNACLSQNEDLRLREHGDQSLCDICPDTTCVHNHIHLRRTL